MEWAIETLINKLFTFWSAVGLLLIIIVVLYWKVSNTYGTWKKQGIPGPTPIPFFGMNPVKLFRDGMKEYVKECAEKYGKICGTFVGMTPVLVLTDPELIKVIWVKEFTNFVNRVDEELRSTSPHTKAMFLAQEEVWRRLRSASTPIFSSSKLKQMVPLMNEGLDTLVGKLGECADRGEAVEIGEYFSKFTMETIFKSAFGVDAKCQTDPGDRYTAAANSVLHFSHYENVLLKLVPFLKFALVFGENISALRFLIASARIMIQTRRKDGHPPRTDLLKLLMEAEIKNEDGSVKNKLSDDEIESQCVTFFAAGFDTTATLLTYFSYALATHPEIQHKLCMEIDEHFPKDTVPDYDTVGKLEYLEKVVNEVLRMFPPGQMIRRECTKKCTVGGIEIPKHAVVVIPTHVLHHDKQLWSNPEVFDPERFSPEAKASRHQCAYMPFGTGPRNCVGMRFALLETKTSLVRVLRRFKFEATPKTECKIDRKSKIVTCPAGGVWIKVVKRQ